MPTTHDLTIGAEVNERGFRTDGGSPYGALAPGTIDGITVQRLRGIVTNLVGMLRFAGTAQLPGEAFVTVVYGASQQVQLDWNNTDAYTATDQAWTDYLDANVGQTVSVTIYKASEPIPSTIITDTVPATPREGQTGVLINGSGFGATQGASTVTYGGLPCTVTGWSDTQITVNWPVISSAGSTLGFKTNHTLEVLVP